VGHWFLHARDAREVKATLTVQTKGVK